jgi:hypothetical protein
MSDILTPANVASTLGVNVDALGDIKGFPPLIQRGGITGYSVNALLAWGQALHHKSIDGTREAICLFDAAELLGCGVRELAQIHTRGMPRFDPRLPRALSMAGELIGFVKDELLHYRDQRDAMAAQAGEAVN